MEDLLLLAKSLAVIFLGGVINFEEWKRGVVYGFFLHFYMLISTSY